MSRAGSPTSPAPAPCWVLLRGLARESGHWGDFPERLRQALPGSRVLTPDLPGTGLRHREPGPASIEALTAALRAALPPGLGPLHLLGLSLGGMVATAWARRHPEELASLTLLNTSLRPHAGPTQRLRPAAWPMLLRHLLGPTGDLLAREATILAWTSARHAGDPVLPQAWAALARRHPVRRLTVARQLFAAARFHALAPPWPTRASAGSPAPKPIRIACGLQDRLVSPACSEALAAAWGLPLLRLPQAGHDLSLDAGVELADWLARETAATAGPDPLSGTRPAPSPAPS